VNIGVDLCHGRFAFLTFRKVSNDPFSMYSVIIITGLPVDIKKKRRQKYKIYHQPRWKEKKNITCPNRLMILHKSIQK